MKLILPLLLLTLLFAHPALAGNWGENWGTMLWGESLSVPSLPGFGFIALAIGLAATAAWLLRKRRLALGFPVLLLAAAGIATAVPNTFQNGEVADADQVNVNFSALESRIAVLDGIATAVPTTFANGTVADAIQVNANFGALDSRVTALEAAAGIPTDRFTACPDGLTVADNETGLLWERKTGTPGPSVNC